jgi:hypothetical protein
VNFISSGCVRPRCVAIFITFGLPIRVALDGGQGVRVRRGGVQHRRAGEVVVAGEVEGHGRRVGGQVDLAEAGLPLVAVAEPDPALGEGDLARRRPVAASGTRRFA